MQSLNHPVDSLESLLQQLVNGDFHGRWEVAKQLTAYGEAAIAPLALLLQADEQDWEVQWFTTRALAGFDSSLALQALVNFLARSQEPELIAIAAEGIGHFGQAGIEALLPLLENPVHRLTAIQALANIHHEAVLEPLLAAAVDVNPAVREIALPALSSFQDPRVDAVLIAAIKDPVAKVRQAAITLLGLRTSLLDNTELVSLLLPGLWDISPEVNGATTNALGRLGTEPAVTCMARVLTSPYTPESLQINLVTALGWIDKESALSALLSAYSSASVSVKIQQEIVEALSRFRAGHLRQRAGEVLADWLVQLLEEPMQLGSLAQAIALALGNLRYSAAYPLLQSLAEGSDRQTQVYAQAALRQLDAVSQEVAESGVGG
jgi:HEAT repeat protein